MTGALDIQLQPSSTAAAPPTPAGKPPAAAVAHNDDGGLSAFLRVRPRLFGIAYRMLGNAVEAEDLVQDVWVRWQTADRGQVREPAAFLVATTTRLAINVMRSARARRETAVGPWLQEPVDSHPDPRLTAERSQALACGVLLLLEKLTPTERAAYILREAFDYPYRDIAHVLRLEEANARQVVTRARQHVAGDRSMPAGSTEQKRLVEAFVAAARNGDLVRLERLFASDLVSAADGRASVSGVRTAADRTSRVLVSRAGANAASVSADAIIENTRHVM